MFGYLQYQNQQPFPAQENMVDSIKTFLEILDAFSKVNSKAQEIMCAINTGDKKCMWIVLEKYVEEYKDQINQTSSITGVKVSGASNYDELSSEEIQRQLHWLINFIYTIDALNFAANENAKHRMKSFLKSNGFTGPGLMLM